MNATMTMNSPAPGKALQIGLWAAQVLICVAFVVFGGMKFFMPVEALAKMWVWPGQVPEAFLRTMGVVDALGGIGILLPALTRIKPGLGVLAAQGCVLLQIAAIIFHVSRGEYPGLPLNAILLALCLFILWGRTKRAPIAPR